MHHHTNTSSVRLLWLVVLIALVIGLVVPVSREIYCPVDLGGQTSLPAK